MSFDRLALLVTSDSKHSRLLQLADVITGCTAQYVAGEEKFAPITVEHVKPLLRRESGRVGGVGIKLHPDFRYANLYHWLFGDDTLWRGAMGVRLPEASRPFALSADNP